MILDKDNAGQDLKQGRVTRTQLPGTKQELPVACPRG